MRYPEIVADTVWWAANHVPLLKMLLTVVAAFAVGFFLGRLIP